MVSSITPRIGSRTIVGISTSLKSGRSATRSLLASGLTALASTYPDVVFLDLRDHRVPLFEGLTAKDVECHGLQFWRSSIVHAGALLLGVPAYWGGVSGVFKNFIDVLCGSKYDVPEVPTVFAGKRIGLIVVGDDARSARLGGEQATHVIDSVGGRVHGNPVLVANPRQSPTSLNAAMEALVALSADLARVLLVGCECGR
jgi:NAD(P)H-dependent FMN reductase